MFNTIILVIIGIIGTIYLFRVVDGIEYNTLRVSDILIAILCFGIIINANITSKNESNAYNNGYNNAVHDAELVSVGEHTYLLQFGNNIHEYTFD